MVAGAISVSPSSVSPCGMACRVSRWRPHSCEIVAVTRVRCVTNIVPRMRRMGMPSTSWSYHLIADPVICSHTSEKSPPPSPLRDRQKTWPSWEARASLSTLPPFPLSSPLASLCSLTLPLLTSRVQSPPALVHSLAVLPPPSPLVFLFLWGRKAFPSLLDPVLTAAVAFATSVARHCSNGKCNGHKSAVNS